MYRNIALKLCLVGLAAVLAVPATDLYAQREGRGNFRRGNRDAGTREVERAQSSQEGTDQGDSQRRSESKQDETSEDGNQVSETSGTLREQVLNQLRSLDINLNGRLEPQEGNLLSRTIMEAVGLDPGQVVHLATLQSLIHTIDLEKIALNAETGIQPEEAASSLEFPRASNRNSAGSDFQVHPILSDPQPLQERYSPLVLEELRSLLARYDQNHNNVLDANEIANVPWGSPSPVESDLDLNGQLNEIELAERLSSLSGATSSGRSSRGRRSRRNESPEQQAARAQREVEREKAAAERRDRERQRRNSNEDKVAVYVRELITRFDKDGDGAMSLEEAKEMRNPPPQSSDNDEDGKLTTEELYAYYGADQTPSGSATTTKSDRNNSETDEKQGPLEGSIKWNGELPREPASSDQEWPRELSGKDANQDGMVSLAEFAPDIDENLRRDFGRWDKNSDGFVTPTETGTATRSERPASSLSSESRSSNSDAGGSGGSRSASSRRAGSRGSRSSSGRGSNTETTPAARSGSDTRTDSGNPSNTSTERSSPPDAVRYDAFSKSPSHNSLIPDPSPPQGQ